MERSRRQPVQNAASKAKSALEQLKAAREGAVSRAAAYEYKQEEALYDVVDDQQYAELVRKRREEAGDFVVDDEGRGYVDIGEDDYWNRGDASQGDEEEDEGKPPGKKRRKGDEKGTKGKAEDGPSKPEGANIHTMFRKAAASRGLPTASRPPAKVTDASSDELLASVLGDLAADAAPLAAPAAARPAVGAYGGVPGYQGAARPPGARMPGMAVGLAGRAPLYGLPQRPAIPPMAALHAIQHADTTAALAAQRAAEESGAEADQHMQEAYDEPPEPMDTAAAAEEERTTKVDDVTMSVIKAPPAAVQEQESAAPQSTTPSAAAALASANGLSTPGGDTGAANGSAAAARERVEPEAGGRMFADVPITPKDGASKSAAEAWDAMYSAAGPATDAEPAAQPSPLPDATPGAGADAAAGQAPLPLDASGRLPFFYLDAYENPDVKPGEAILFGKVQVEGRWQSASVVVRGLQRCLFVVPKPEVFEDSDGELARLEAAAKQDPARRVELIKALQERCAGVREEVRGLLQRAGVGAMRMVPVKRCYAFENKAVPHGEQWVLKVRYPATMPAMDAASGRTFVAVFGANQSGLEALMLKRALMGPSWLAIDAPQRVEYASQATWCKVEVLADSPKCILSAGRGLSPDAAGRPPPPLVVASLSLKTQINPKSHQHEIVAVGVVHLSGVSPDAPMDWNRPQLLRNFSIVRKLDGQAWPHGLEAEVAKQNASERGRVNGGNMILLQTSERSLLTCLLAKLQQVDADVLVGHNVAAFDLTVLLSRMQHHKVPLWSRIGRVKKTEFPKLTGGGHTFGGGAGPGVMSTVAGRLLCDTYLSARELVKSVDFTLATLAQSLLSQQRLDLAAAAGVAASVGSGANADIAACFGSADGVLRLLRHGESDAWLALGIMFHLSVLPLSKQLAVISGHLWGRTLAGQRAQRIEMLLMHEFHRRKFIVPDRMTFKDKERARLAAQVEEGEGGDDDEEGSGAKAKGGKKGGSGPKYAGGLVLEPKKGLYDKLVLMLDFNSLYPSIIQEYNICFTTVQRPTDGSLPPLPQPPTAEAGLAPLPSVLQGLVNRRKQVKMAMASTRDPVTKQQLHIRQQAIKLTANSMYGCLGFGASRFYAQPLAELITAQGRSILGSTVELVQHSIGAEVIYGDTDSIMVATRTENVDEVRQLGARIKQEVNKRYRLLEIELDGVFRCMLLLKKKKYAAIKLEPAPEGNGRLVEVQEQKGLDIVRRDWCPLSKDVGNHALAAILSGRGREEVVQDIHAHLREVAARVRAGQVPLGKFIITKQLTKRPDEYPDAKNQPHVQVAMRRKAAGKRDGVLPGETVPYVICVSRALPQQLQQQQADADNSAIGTPGGALPAAAAAASAPSPELASAAAAAAGGATPSSSATVAAAAAAASAASCSGSLAERARHPEELRENPSLAIDVEYYLTQQVHPVVSRLCSPIEGTDAAHIAECLGLDPSRFRGSAGGGHGNHTGDDDEAVAALMSGASGTMMDDEENFRDCAPLRLTSPNGTCWAVRGVGDVLKGLITADAMLTPPDAVGDESARVTKDMLAAQVLLRAREVISRYYDGALRPDDETAEVAGGCRAAVLRPSGDANRCAHPDPARAGVLLSRAVSERALYMQLCHYYRLMHVEGAVRRQLVALRASDPKTQVTADDLRQQIPDHLRRALAAGCEALDTLRARSHWHWVDLQRLFGGVPAAAGGGGKDGAKVQAAGGAVRLGQVQGMVA